MGVADFAMAEIQSMSKLHMAIHIYKRRKILAVPQQLGRLG